jgi:hypothetical protein
MRRTDRRPSAPSRSPQRSRRLSLAPDMIEDVAFTLQEIRRVRDAPTGPRR